MTTAYDLVRYPSWPVPETHPAVLGVFAALYGRKGAASTRCRVLEIGCGEGVNLMSMAVGAPMSEFVGVDRAETAIARGRETARAAGLANVTLHARDLRDPPQGLGRFDYVVAHGIYAWVPQDVRVALMRFIGESLGPDGLAYISYNAYPGCRLREVLRDLLRGAVRGLEDPAERLAAAQAMLGRQIDVWSKADPFERALVEEARDMCGRPPELLFHDELGPIYAPQLLGAVVEAARAEGLDYLCDAKAELNAEAFWPSKRFEHAIPFTGGDWTRFEQLVDFDELRRFRRSVFVRAGGSVDRRFVPERLGGLWADAEITLLKQDPKGPEGFVFRAADGAEIATHDRRFADFLIRLGLAYPMSLPLDTVVGSSELAGALLHLFVSRIATLSTSPSPFVLSPGERPLASPLARVQAAQGETFLASLRHKPVQMEDASARAFIALMDGTRTRRDLATALAERPGVSLETAIARMPEALTEMARLGLMKG